MKAVSCRMRNRKKRVGTGLEKHRTGLPRPVAGVWIAFCTRQLA